MDTINDTKEKIKEIDNHFFANWKDLYSGYDDLQQFILEQKKLVQIYKKSGDIKVLSEMSLDLKQSKRKPGKKKINTVSNASDIQSENSADLEETSTRPRRKASAMADIKRKNAEIVSSDLLNNIKVKVERISDIEEEVEKDCTYVVVKQEALEMPTFAVPLNKTRTKHKVIEPRQSNRTRKTKDMKDVEEVLKPPRASTRKNKKENSYMQKKNTFLVEIEESPGEDVFVSQHSNQENVKEKNQESRNTTKISKKSTSTDRSKKPRSTSTSRNTCTTDGSVTYNKKKKKSQDDEWQTEETAECEPSIYEDAETNGEMFTTPEVEINEPTQGKSKSSATKKNFEDGPKQIHGSDETFVVEKDNEKETEMKNNLICTNLNETKVIKKGKNSNVLKFTETEIKKNTKETIEKTPVRKKIEAFEKMRTPVDVPLMRITRTKSKKQNKENVEQTGETVNKEKNKDTPYTPLATNRILPSSSTMSQTMSALKASKEYFLEREKRKKEKEAEAFKKKEALKQSQLEEKRRIREEKEQKAKLQREAIEKEKQMLIKEKQKKLQKQKEETERKKLEAKQKLEEIKQAEEIERRKLESKQKLQEMKQAEEEEREKRTLEKKKLLQQQKIEQQRIELKAQEILRQKMEQERLESKAKQIQAQQMTNRDQPIYLTTKAPLLPSFDCYDSDENEENKSAIPRPPWTSRENMRESVRIMMHIDDKLKNTMFSLKPQTVDLRKIFQNIDPQKLRRNSSAVWKTRPRFTLMESLCEF